MYNPGNVIRAEDRGAQTHDNRQGLSSTNVLFPANEQWLVVWKASRVGVETRKAVWEDNAAVVRRSARKQRVRTRQSLIQALWDMDAERY